MIAQLDEHRQEVVGLCRQFGVRRLEVFGSATSGEFDAARSDIDFLVELEPPEGTSRFDAFFGLKEELEALLGRPVDLVDPSALDNPYFAAMVERTRQGLYARVILGPTSGTLDVPSALVVEFVADRSWAEYEVDPLLRSAVERQFEIVREALSQLGRAAPDVAARVPDLARIVAFRNLLIHGYAAIDDRLVWEVATERAAPLLAVLDDLLGGGP